MDLAAKLQLKGPIRVLHAPHSLQLPQDDQADDVLVFVKDRAGLAAEASAALEAARSDRIAWIAYPKAGKLGTDLNRDILWDLLKGKGVKPVRQVAIDETWSALRFRPA